MRSHQLAISGRALVMVVGLLLVQRAGAMPPRAATTQTITSSTSSSTKVVSYAAGDQTKYQTRVTALLDGRTVYDQTSDVGWDADADGLLTKAILAVGGPACASAPMTVSRTPTSTQTTSDVVTGTEEIVTHETTIGPGTIIIGDRDNGGTAFEVLAGTTNVNTNTNTQTNVERTVTTTEVIATHLEITGTCTTASTTTTMVDAPASFAPAAEAITSAASYTG